MQRIFARAESVACIVGMCCDTRPTTHAPTSKQTLLDRAQINAIELRFFAARKRRLRRRRPPSGAHAPHRRVRASATRRHRRQNAHQNGQAAAQRPSLRRAYSRRTLATLQNADDVAFLLRCRNDAYAQFFNFEANDKNKGVVYCKLHSSVSEASALREKFDGIRYIGERRTTRVARAATTNRNTLYVATV